MNWTNQSPPITINGITKTRAEWCRKAGISTECAIQRIKAGWPAERAVTTPTDKQINLAYRNKPTKICLGCKRELRKSFLNFGQKGRNNWRSHCVRCVTEARRTKNIQTRSGWSYARRTALGLYASARSRAREKALPMEITREWIQAKIERGACEATGIKFDQTQAQRAFVPSLDRIDSTKGYTADNVKVVVWIHNAARNNWGDAALHSYIKQYLKFLLAKKSRRP